MGRCAASTSMLAPILDSMSTPPAPAPSAGEGIPGSGLPGPFPVGEYAAALKMRLREFTRVQLVGELVNLRPSRARVYFELRDSAGAIPCAVWLRDWEAMAARAGATPGDGMQVVVAGGCDYYPGSATSSPGFSFAVSEMRIAGEGDLLARIERLRKQLDAEGLLEPQKLLARPPLPRSIGVVTAEGGKARDDILAGLARRGWAGRLVWAFAPVQDRHAAPAIARVLGDLAAVRTSSTVLSIGVGCAAASPCNVRFGYQVYSIANSATATVGGSGIGTAYVYLNNSGTLMVGNNLTVTCSAGCTQQAGITSFPPNVLPLYTWTATNGTWDITGGRDQRAFLSAKTLAAGQGIVVTEAPGQSTLAVDNGVIPTYLMNSVTLTFPSIATGTCAADQTMTVTGANPGDAVAPGWPALPAGVFGIMLVSATNTVTVRLCNLSGSGAAPPSATYRATIVRNY